MTSISGFTMIAELNRYMYDPNSLALTLLGAILLSAAKRVLEASLKEICSVVVTPTVATTLIGYSYAVLTGLTIAAPFLIADSLVGERDRLLSPVLGFLTSLYLIFALSPAQLCAMSLINALLFLAFCLSEHVDGSLVPLLHSAIISIGYSLFVTMIGTIGLQFIKHAFVRGRRNKPQL